MLSRVIEALFYHRHRDRVITIPPDEDPESETFTRLRRRKSLVLIENGAGMRIFSILFLSLCSFAFCDVVIEKAIVTKISVDKWKGSWAAPGGKYVKYFRIKLLKYRQENESEADQKIFDAIDPETGELDVTLESYPATYIAGGSPLVKFFRRHIGFFSGKVKPELQVVGTLRFGKIPSNSDRKDYNLLIDPIFTSRKGILDIKKWSVSKNPSSPTNTETLRKSNFLELYGD